MSITEKLLDLFLDNPGRVLSKEEIYITCWEVQWHPLCSTTLRSMISYVRPKLKGKLISVRGKGYIYLP